MEPILENVYTDTEEMMREQYGYGGKKRRILYMVLYVLFLIYSLYRILSNGSWLHWVIAAFSLSYIVYLLLLPRIRAKKYIQKQQALYDGEVPQTIVQFYDHEVTVRMGRTNDSIPYEKITKMIVLKHSIALIAENAASISVSPDHFTKGSRQEMYRFLSAKCPKLQFPEWNW